MIQRTHVHVEVGKQRGVCYFIRIIQRLFLIGYRLIIIIFKERFTAGAVIVIQRSVPRRACLGIIQDIPDFANNIVHSDLIAVIIEETESVLRE